MFIKKYIYIVVTVLNCIEIVIDFVAACYCVAYSRTTMQVYIYHRV